MRDRGEYRSDRRPTWRDRARAAARLRRGRALFRAAMGGDPEVL